MTMPSTDDEQPTDTPHSPPPPRRRRRRITVEDDEDSDDDEIIDLTAQRYPTRTTRPHKRTTHLTTTTLTKNLSLIPHRHKQNDINFTPPTLNAIKPLASMIPSLPIATFNVTSLSADVVDEIGLRRQKHMIADIEALTHKASIIFIQETRLNRAATHTSLEAAFPLWRIFYNNPTHNKGGTLIMLSPHTRYHYNTHTEPLSPDLQGQAQCLRLEGRTRNGNTPLPFRLLNVYLATGEDHHRRRAKQLKLLSSIPNNMHLIIGGDFNFVEYEDDATNYSDYHTLKKGADAAWDNLTHKHSLWETHQPTHTNISPNTKDPGKSRTSRIDRFYITHNEADATQVSAQASPHPTPHSATATLGGKQGIRHTTHIPLLLTFSSPTQTHNKGIYRLPSWIPKTQEFKRIFRSLWNEHLPSPNTNPFTLNTRIKRTAKAAHKQFTRAHKDHIAHPLRHIDDLTASIRLLHAATHSPINHTNIETLLTLNPDLRDHLPPGDNDTTYDIGALRHHISSLLTRGEPHPALAQHHRDDDDRSDGAAIFKNAGAKIRCPTDHIAPLLPSSSKTIHTLRIKPSDPPTTCPKQQARMAKGFWGEEIWSKRKNAPSAEFRADYLKNYNKTLPDHIKPKPPTLETILDILKKPKSTSPGPDGNPFTLYSELSDITAPILHGIICFMADGNTPPKSFNMGDLCLFPKDDTTLISRTRPITMNNFDNRIIAAAVSHTLMPSVDFVSERCQKGFINGRKGEENIKDITDKFYSALLAQEQHFFLFIDTAKAFDSIDHPFLFDVLAKIGMPAWVLNLVQGLMHEVQVRPRLGGRSKTAIDIHRGVKQGCPLSPLLFILAYDPLLTRLTSIPGADVFAFADDAVISHRQLTAIPTITKEIDAFGVVSGFGVNTEKSDLLRTMPTTPHDEAILALTDWEGLSFTTRATYLGVLMGVDVTTEDIYAKPYKRYVARLLTHRPALAHLHNQGKVHLFNIYLFPLFSYLFHFYILPDKGMGDNIRAHARQNIISFNGRAYKYPHLISPKYNLGLSQPLRDPWAANLAALASQFAFSNVNPCPFITIPGKHYLNSDDPRFPHVIDKREWNTLLIDDHITSAALDIMNTIAPRDTDNNVDMTHYDVSKYKHKHKALRKKLYKLALLAWQDEQIDDITEKIIRRNMTEGNTDIHDHTHTYSLLDNCQYLLPSLPANIHNHQRLIIFNSLATDCRRDKPAGTLPHRGPPDNPHPCYFCGEGPDHLAHIHTDCRVTRAARNTFSQAIGLDLGHERADYGLTRPTPTPPPPDHVLQRTANATILFNWAIWSCRRTHFTQTDHYEHNTSASTHISTFAITHWNRVAPPRWQTSGHSNTPPDPALLGPSPYGSAGKRTPKQKRQALAFGKSKIAKIPHHHFIAYTDGASKGNSTKRRSPCGAGALLALPLHNGTRREIEDFAALGSNTNNFGEVWGIGAALSLFLTHSQPNDTLHSLTDSAHASIAITKHQHPKSNRALVHAVRKTYYHTLKDRHVYIHWVPAHVGIEGNERADGLADEGARQSDLGHYLRPLQLLQRIRDGHFVCHHEPPHPPHPPPAKRRRQTEPQLPPPKRARTTTSTRATTAALPNPKRARPAEPTPPPHKRARTTQTMLTFARAEPLTHPPL
jgi:ribonuclease HI/exonuclease III